MYYGFGGNMDVIRAWWRKRKMLFSIRSAVLSSIYTLTQIKIMCIALVKNKIIPFFTIRKETKTKVFKATHDLALLFIPYSNLLNRCYWTNSLTNDNFVEYPLSVPHCLTRRNHFVTTSNLLPPMLLKLKNRKFRR